MTIQTLRAAMPTWAQDISANLAALVDSDTLTEQQKWGTLLAAAAATRNESVLIEVAGEAREHLGEAAYDGAMLATTTMAMNNIAYRTREFLGEDYAKVPMNLPAPSVGGLDPSIAADFELWVVAASAINGCAKCLGAHQAKARAAGLSERQVWEAVRIASVLNATAQAVMVVESLG